MDVESIPCFKEMFMSRKVRDVFRYLVSKCNSGTEVPYKVNGIKNLVIIHRSGADNTSSVYFIDPRDPFSYP